MNEERYDICSRRSCGWTGTDKEKTRRREHEYRLPTWTHCCPKCGNDSFYEERPLFIPLKREFFEGFRDGTKSEEYRLYGSRWNERTCRIGREVILSLGYGKRHRLKGVITGFRVKESPKTLPGWIECYGEAKGEAVCIKIEVEKGAV